MGKNKDKKKELYEDDWYDVFVGGGMDGLIPYQETVQDAVGLASYGSASQGRGSIKKIREVIEKSSVVVFALGHKYGYIEPKYGKSFPEVQLDIAQELRKPVLAYIPDETASWPISQVDTDRTRVRALQNRLKEHYSVRLYTSALDLHEMIINDLENYWESDLSRVPEKERAVKEEIGEKQVRVVRLLLSSPGDVANERNIFQRAVDRYNQDWLISKGVFIKLLRWEDMAPQIGPRPQRTLNKQFGYYDIFSGIMWNRFGTRTDLAASGTEEEFDTAIRSWRKTGRPWITFYFCDRPSLLITKEDIKQRERVLRFRSKLKQLGILRTFKHSRGFQDLVCNDLKRITSRPEFMDLSK